MRAARARARARARAHPHRLERVDVVMAQHLASAFERLSCGGHSGLVLALCAVHPPHGVEAAEGERVERPQRGLAHVQRLVQQRPRLLQPAPLKEQGAQIGHGHHGGGLCAPQDLAPRL